MLLVFEVHLSPGQDGGDILSEEILASTHAQVMTVDEAAALGFSGLPDDPSLRLIAVIPKDRGFIAAALERAASVVGFRVHEVET
jgi:hypothetical protein